MLQKRFEEARRIEETKGQLFAALSAVVCRNMIASGGVVPPKDVFPVPWSKMALMVGASLILWAGLVALVWWLI